MVSKLRVTAFALILVLALTGTTQAGERPETETYEDQLLGPVPPTEDDDCRDWNQCQEYRGIAIADINVSDVMESDDGEGGYNLIDQSMQGLLTTWTLCKYTQDKVRLNCDYDIHMLSKKGGDLPNDTRHLRVMVEDGIAPEYWLKVMN